MAHVSSASWAIEMEQHCRFSSCLQLAVWDSELTASLWWSNYTSWQHGWAAGGYRVVSGAEWSAGMQGHSWLRLLPALPIPSSFPPKLWAQTGMPGTEVVPEPCKTHMATLGSGQWWAHLVVSNTACKTVIHKFVYTYMDIYSCLIPEVDNIGKLLHS